MKIVNIRRKINPEFIESLEKLLADAKSGEINAIVYALSYEDGSTANGWVSPDKNLMAIIGEVETLKFELITNLVDTRNEHSK